MSGEGALADMGAENAEWFVAQGMLAPPESFNDIESSQELVQFLEYGMIKMMETMASRSADAVCPDCAVGLTAKHGDMFSLALNDFICSDFYSESGSSHYPGRDCEADDLAWCVSPTHPPPPRRPSHMYPHPHKQHATPRSCPEAAPHAQPASPSPPTVVTCACAGRLRRRSLRHRAASTTPSHPFRCC